MDPSREPSSADEREMASSLFGMFNALVLEGFTEAQALVIIGQCITAALQANS